MLVKQFARRVVYKIGVIIMLENVDFIVLLFILGGIIYGIATLGFWFAFGVAIVYFLVRVIGI